MTILKIVTTFERKKYHYSVETSWSLSAIVTLGAFCQQVIIYQFYSASLVSHLLMKPVTNIRTLKDLINSPLKAGCEDILYDRDYFKVHSTDEITKELLYKKILGKRNTSNFLSPEQGLKLVEQGGYAFHVETATAYPIIEATFGEKAICELREIQLFRTQPMHANFQKHSPFRDMLDTWYVL
ncbi:Lig chan domain containing protein [Asbolus verrucosus]|uniref:Lig chan domain containing protein n=1 Tax=Asbolus verrucosus TaxID=1661398 RepID=A0A482VVX3_ASBVE|nr:Lig chan domain containing protein [Asbolus verrucosus]